jgi:hypothetical protein
MTQVRPATREAASFRARAGGYIVDMVIFCAVAMIMAAIAGGIFLFVTDGAQEDPSDAQYYVMFGFIGFGVPLVWTVMNVALLVTRHQTGGHYVAGVRLRAEDGSAPGIGTAVAWWFALNPLFFSWPMALVSGLALTAISVASLGNWDLVVTGAFLSLCLVALPVALIAAAVDGRHRTLSDRIAGTIVATG